MVEPEYATGWYKAETFAEINRHIIIALGILNGDIHCLHNERSIESAEYTIEEFFSSKSVSASFMQAIQDDYEEVCSDYKLRCSGSGMITPTYLEFDIALELTAIGIAKDIIHLLRINRIAKLGARKLVFQGSKLMDDAGEVIARYSDDALRELKFIDEGGEVIGLSDDVIRYADENGKLVEEELALIKKDGKLGFRKVVNVNNVFTNSQIDDYVVLATKQNEQTTKVMLGKFEGKDNPLSYHKRAGNDHSYFDMGDKWDEALEYVNGDLDEMWKINKKFIDNQRAMGKEFYLSHNPSDPKYYKGFYKREIDYLTKPIDQGGLGGQIIDQGNNLWKIVW